MLHLRRLLTHKALQHEEVQSGRRLDETFCVQSEEEEVEEKEVEDEKEEGERDKKRRGAVAKAGGVGRWWRVGRRR